MRNRILSPIVIFTLIFSTAFASLRPASQQPQTRPEIRAEIGVSPFGISPFSISRNLENLTRLTGAYYDPKNHELVLLGTSEPGLPHLRLDDFLVALRAMYANDYPAVSIDPGDDPEAMDVSYWGNTENTHFGHVMFEADRLLKVLSMGKDNLTGNAAASGVRDFKTYLKRSAENYSESEQSNAWFRMWFEPANTTVLTTSDKQAILLQSPAMIAKTEYLEPGLGKDRNAEDFVEHINANYPEYGNNHPVLVELQQLEQWLLVAKWIRDSGIPVDLSFLNSLPAEGFETPSTTPTITVDETFASGGYLITLSLYGGVDFRIPNDNYQVSHTDVNDLIESARAARPDSSTITWNTEIDSSLFQAVAMSPTRTTRAGSFTKRELDLGVRTSIASLGFSRYYDSFSQASDAYSFGWKPFPFEMTFPNGKDTYDSLHRQIAIVDYESQAVRTFHLSTEGLSGKLVYYAPPSEAQSALELNADGSLTWHRNDNIAANFDADGRLIYVQDALGRKLQYSYSDTGQLDHIQDEAGDQIRFEYDDMNRVARAIGPTEESQYTYDSQGDLVTVANSNGHTRKYRYDQAHRLLEIADESNNILVGNEYDDLGRVKSQTVDGLDYLIEYEPAGNRLSVTNRDDPDNFRNYEYDDLGRLTAIGQTEQPDIRYEYRGLDPSPSVFEIDNERFETVYNWQGHLVEVSSPSTRRRVFNHGMDGRMTSLIDPGGEITNFERNDQGRLLRVVTGLDQPGNVHTLERDDQGRLQSITDAQGDVRTLESMKQIVNETGKPVLELFDIGNKMLLCILMQPDGTILEVELTEDRLIKGSLFTNPELLLLSNLTLAEKFEQAPDIMEDALGSLVAANAVIVGNSDLSNVNFNKIFPNQAVIRSRSKDPNRVVANVNRSEQTILNPSDTAIINGIPASSSELQAIGLSDDFAIWQDINPQWTQTGRQFGYSQQSGASAFSEALQNSANVIVMIAHANGNSIFWPDGTQTTSQDVDQLRAQIQENQPLVMLFSCETARLDAAPDNLVDSLLDAGARGVIGPTTTIEASGKSLEFFSQMLQASSQGHNVFEALRGSEIYVDYDALEFWVRTLNFIAQ